jgi:hypothetical protein
VDAVIPEHVEAALVTRGDVQMAPIVGSLPFASVVWDNSARGTDLAVYGRYQVIEETTAPVIYVQDDDVILPPESIAHLLDAYEPGKVVCNMPPPWRRRRFYQDHALVGFGALFDRDLPRRAFDRLQPAARAAAKHDPDGTGFLAWFLQTCDVAFTCLTPRVLVDVPYGNLPHATAPDRMWRQPHHEENRRLMLNLARKVRDGRG